MAQGNSDYYNLVKYILQESSADTLQSTSNSINVANRYNATIALNLTRIM